MKKYVLFLLLIAAMLLPFLMAADRRHHGRQYTVSRIEVPTITIPDGDANEVTWSSSASFRDGLCQSIEQIVLDVSDACDAITLTLAVRDSDGAVLVSEASIAENTSTVLLSTKATPDFDKVFLEGDYIIGVTPSADPNGADVTVDIDLYGR